MKAALQILALWISYLFTGPTFIDATLVGLPQAEEGQRDQDGPAEWISGESNADFLSRIKGQKPVAKAPADHGSQGGQTCDIPDESSNSAREFFGMFDGSAHDTESDAFRFFADFFKDDETKNEGSTGGGTFDGGNFLSGSKDEKESDDWWNKFQLGTKQEKIVTDLLLRTGEDERKEGFVDTLRVFQEAFDTVKVHLNETFKDIDFFGSFDILQFLYFMDKEEEIKNPVWKRRVHRHYQSLAPADAETMYPALFLSHLSYTKSCHDVNTFAQKIGEGNWILRNCTMESRPHNPAHFLVVRRIMDGLPHLGIFDFLNEPLRALSGWDTLEVALVVRGTKTIGDMLTDSILKPCDYRGGKAHDGILRAAMWLFQSYKEDLRELLKESGKKKLKLWLIGHSLGAGTASLAAIEFLECCSSWIDVEAVGFGTPALLSPDLSYRYRNTITTIVSDADAVPRMSGATLVNTWYRILSHDFGDDLLFEFDHLTRVVQSKLTVGQSTASDFVKDIRKWMTEKIDHELRPRVAKIRSSNRTALVPDLIPPGECVHLYRDGTAWQGNYVNCSFFDELDVAWHAVDDHLIPTGYFKSLLDFLRNKKNNVAWMFKHNLLEIPM